LHSEDCEKGYVVVTDPAGFINESEFPEIDAKIGTLTEQLTEKEARLALFAAQKVTNPLTCLIIKPVVINAAYKSACEVLDLSEYAFDFLDAEYKDLEYDGDEVIVTFEGIKKIYEVTMYIDGGILRQIQVI